VAPENLQKYTDWIQGPWIKLISNQEGFRETHYMTKPNGEWVVLKFWETEAHDQRWAENLQHQELAKPVLPMFVGDLSRDVFEIKESVFSG
jgi:heme-degrading monooxygenase HmoA